MYSPNVTVNFALTFSCHTQLLPITKSNTKTHKFFTISDDIFDDFYLLAFCYLKISLDDITEGMMI